MNEIFGRDYAGAYDALYRGKDYAAEVDLIERILSRHGLDGRRRLLDLGCGTGNHALPLAQRGHAVVGVDRSAAMLARARAKAAAAGAAGLEFHEGDVRQLDLGIRFDAVLMMFTVLGYQLEDAEQMAALATVRRHLEPGGLFIFDVWNGLAVVATGAKDREVSVTDGTARIIRKTRAALDQPAHVCRVQFDLERSEADGRLATWQEEHVLRYHFPDELAPALRRNGLDLLHLRSFPDDERPPDAQAWHVIGAARAL